MVGCEKNGEVGLMDTIEARKSGLEEALRIGEAGEAVIEHRGKQGDEEPRVIVRAGARVE